MKSIEKKLKNDAKAFSQVPSQEIQDGILDAINQTVIEKPINNTQGLWKIIPAVVAFGLMVMVGFHFSSYQLNQLPPESQAVQLNQTTENLLNSIEISLTNPIIKEQQALISDVAYIQSLIVL